MELIKYMRFVNLFLFAFYAACILMGRGSGVIPLAFLFSLLIAVTDFWEEIQQVLRK